MQTSGLRIFFAVVHKEKERSITPNIPNSEPLRGKDVMSHPAPNQERTVRRRNEPQAAHPTPNTPAIVPRVPVVRPLDTSSLMRRLRKNTNIDKLMPKRMAMAMVYVAERVEKLVEIEPRRFIRNMIFSPKERLESNMLPMRERFGSHVAIAKTAKAAKHAISTYPGLLNTSLRANNRIICASDGT